MIITPDQIANFPVAHFSPSSIRKYLENPHGFFKTYVRYEYDDTLSPALLEGGCMHKVLAGYYEARMKAKERIDFEWGTATAAAIAETFNEEDVKRTEWGKTGSLEKSKQTIGCALESYMAELPTIDHVVSVEERLLSDFEDLSNDPMPIPLKGFTDLVTLQDDEYVIRDHKFISYFSDPENLAEVAKYEMQAAPYFFLVRKRYGKNPVRMIFDEIKKTKNRDGSPQVRSVVIEYTPRIINRWVEIYKRIVKQLAGVPLIDRETGVMQFLPNPFAQYGEDAWLDFCEEVDEGKVWTFDSIKTIQSSKFSRPEEVEALF